MVSADTSGNIDAASWQQMATWTAYPTPAPPVLVRFTGRRQWTESIVHLSVFEPTWPEGTAMGEHADQWSAGRQ